MTLTVVKQSHKANVFVRDEPFPKISLKTVLRKLTIFYIQQNDELKMTMKMTSILYAKPVSVRHSGYVNHSDIYTILNISGLVPTIEHSYCNRTYDGLQTAERYTYEQKTSYRRPPTRRNSGGVT